MNPEFQVSLNIAQIVMLGALVFGLAKMSTSVTALKEATDKHTLALESISQALADIVGRVMVLEDRAGRRRHTDP